MVPIEKTQGCLNFQLRRTSRLLGRYYDDALRHLGLRITQFNLLAVLAQTGPIAITALAELVGMERSALARNLKPIERRKLVTVIPGKDKRTRTVTLAPAGRRKLEEALPKWDQAQTQLIRKMKPDRASGLVQALAKIRTAIGEES
jgi:DNA-binding MarR family transcriptional regulator